MEQSLFSPVNFVLVTLIIVASVAVVVGIAVSVLKHVRRRRGIPASPRTVHDA